MKPYVVKAVDIAAEHEDQERKRQLFNTLHEAADELIKKTQEYEVAARRFHNLVELLDSPSTPDLTDHEKRMIRAYLRAVRRK